MCRLYVIGVFMCAVLMYGMYGIYSVSMYIYNPKPNGLDIYHILMCIL